MACAEIIPSQNNADMAGVLKILTEANIPVQITIKLAGFSQEEIDSVTAINTGQLRWGLVISSFTSTENVECAKINHLLRLEMT